MSQDLDFGMTGMIANHVRPQELGYQATTGVAGFLSRGKPDGTACRDGFHWHSVLGEIPDTMSGWDIHQAVLAHERSERERPEREARAAAERAREAAELAQADEEARHKTPEGRIEVLEARLAALELRLERLTMPTRIGSRSRPKPARTAQEGGDLPPAA